MGKKKALSLKILCKFSVHYGTPSLSYNAVNALYGMVILIYMYDVVRSIYYVVISIL